MELCQFGGLNRCQPPAELIGKMGGGFINASCSGVLTCGHNAPIDKSFAKKTQARMNLEFLFDSWNHYAV